MHSVTIRPRAIDDIVACAVHIGRDSPQAADRFLDAVESACSQLPDYPRRGARYHWLERPGLEIRWTLVPGFKNHLMFYEMREDVIDVIRVLHGARDLQNLI